MAPLLPFSGLSDDCLFSSERSPQPMTRAAKAREVYDFRRKRETILSPGLLGEPGWDILLLLYFLEAEGTPISVAGVCVGSGTPPTTGLRWVKVLETEGLIARQADTEDKRRSFMMLTDDGRAKMERLLDQFM